MRWCVQCVLPDSRPNLTIGADGVCNACRFHESKKDVDWSARAADFRQVVERARINSQGYDCLIPVSGGKDSHWQVITCLEYGLRPLAVTWRPPARTSIGTQNLENLVSLGVDHIDYQIDPHVERRFMRAALERVGSPAVPMHMALFNIPLRIAAAFRIPLVLWGENSAFEYGGDEARTGHRLDGSWLRDFGVMHGTTAQDWVSNDLSSRDLAAYFAPSATDLEGVHAIFLGYYFPWDPQTTFAAAQAHGFLSDAGGPRTGYYDFADIDDDFISVHHYLKWYKFGFTRAFDNLSLEIRNGRITRDDAIALIRETGDDTPNGDIEKMCDFLGMTAADFFEIAERFRNLDVWEQRDGVWTIPDFLIPDWSWT